MEKRAEFNTALKNAMKSKDQIATSTVRLILAALKDRDIHARSQGKADGIPESEILQMLGNMVKQRAESSKAYQEAGRDDLSEREEQEIHIIQKFLPRQLNEDELEEAIQKAIEESGAETIRDMGRTMGVLKSKYAGQIDMGVAGAVLKKKLG